MSTSTSVEMLRDFYNKTDSQYASVRERVETLLSQYQEYRALAQTAEAETVQKNQVLKNVRALLFEKVAYRDQLVKSNHGDDHTQSIIDALFRDIDALLSQAQSLEQQAAASEQEELQFRALTADAYQALGSICSQCGSIATALEHYTAVLLTEAEKVQTQAQAFASMSSGRFAHTAGSAADKRHQARQEILSLGTQTQQLADQYWALAQMNTNDSDRVLGPCGPERTAQEALALSNPHYSESDEYQRNCQRCIWAFELLRRGYSVEAKSVNSCDGYSGSIADIRRLWFSAKNARPEQYIRLDQMHERVDDQFAIVERKMKEWGEGSRAIIGNRWKGGQGHVWNVEYSGGKIHYYDGQIGKEVNVKLYNHLTKRLDILARVDDLEVPDDILKAVRITNTRRCNE